MATAPRQRFSDPDAFNAAIAAASRGARAAPLKQTDFQIDLSLAQLPRTALFMVEPTNVQAARPASGDLWSLAIPVTGGFSANVGGRGRHRDFGSGDLHLLHEDRDFGLRAAGSSQILVANVLSNDLRKKAADLACAGTGELAEVISAASPDGGALQRFALHLWRELEGPGGLWDCPLALAEMEDALVSLLASAASPKRSDTKSRTTLATMRRVEEFLMQHLTRPVTRPELAAAAGVSIRTVSRGFQHQYGVGPLAWLKARRLEAAQRELRAAARGEMSVTEVALRYGFDHLGRFAADYRRRFGETPSETLRK